MKWYWKVRIYNGVNYVCGWIETSRDLREIDTIKDFYEDLTGFRMLLEGMSESPFVGVDKLTEVFPLIWKGTPA